MRALAASILGLLCLGVIACSDRAPQAPSGPAPVDPPPFWFDSPPLVVDEHEGMLWIPVRRGASAGSERASIRIIPAGANEDDYVLLDHEARFMSADSTGEIMFSVNADEEVEPAEKLWLAVGDTTSGPSEDDPRFLSIEIRDLAPSAARDPIRLRLEAGRRWPFRVMGSRSSTGGFDGDIWGERFTYRLDTPTEFNGEAFYPIATEGFILPLRLALRQDGSVIRAVVPADTSSQGSGPEYRLLIRRLLESLPWTPFDLSDAPGTEREIVSFDTTFAYESDSSTVSCHLSTQALGRFDVAEAAGRFTGAAMTKLSYSDFVGRRAGPPSYSKSWTLTLTLADSVGVVRVGSNEWSDAYNPPGGGSWSMSFSGSLVP